MTWAAKKKSIVLVLTPRCRQDGMPEYGRFTSREIKNVIHNTNENIKELMPYFIDFDNLGNYTLEYGGLIDLAIYRALRKAGIDQNYATNLVGDIMWQFIISSGSTKFYKLRKELVKLKTKDPDVFLGMYLKDALKFPYAEPGYQVKMYRDGNAYCMDFYSCAVYDFFKQFGQEELSMFRKAHCTFDYSAAERIAEGVSYQREHTLSDGDGVCDQRWSL